MIGARKCQLAGPNWVRDISGGKLAELSHPNGVQGCGRG